MRWTWIGMAVATSLTVWMISAVVYALWLKHEAQKARREMAQRKTLDRIVQASMPPAAPGLNRKRVS
jgi:O-antigen/teichoic acid export membrane protein